VIAVAASDADDKRAVFSNYGLQIDVSAPGVDTLSTLSAGSSLAKRESVVGEKYAYISGTSMACPHVSGLAALLVAKYPTITNEQLRSMLQQTADDLGEPGHDRDFGYGRVNAERALNLSPEGISDLYAALRIAHNTVVNDGAEVIGSAAGRDMARYQIALAPADVTPRVFTTLVDKTSAVHSALLGNLDLSSFKDDGDYVLRLRVLSADGQTKDAFANIVVDRTGKPGWPRQVEGSAPGEAWGGETMR
jgi:hypothetical protein